MLDHAYRFLFLLFRILDTMLPYISFLLATCLSTGLSWFLCCLFLCCVLCSCHVSCVLMVSNRMMLFTFLLFLLMRSVRQPLVLVWKHFNKSLLCQPHISSYTIGAMIDGCAITEQPVETRNYNHQSAHL